MQVNVRERTRMWLYVVVCGCMLESSSVLVDMRIIYACACIHVCMCA